MAIDEQLKEALRARAMYLCEYCHSPEALSASRFTIEHIIPKCLGGDDGFDNLGLVCCRCNERKYKFVSGIDSDTEEVVNIFNPRQQKWADYFIWSNGGTEIKGTTAVGRVTCNRLDLKDSRYPRADSSCNTRSYWCKTGLHPPEDDPCENWLNFT